MIIYKAEASIDGLADKIFANQSISYCSELTPWTPSDRENLQKQHLCESFAAAAKVHGLPVTASAFDSDLFFTKSILVSTNWNKNDDVFTPDQVWASRHTPSHKPTNIEHDENRLVGHITETWALDRDGNLIPDNTVIDDLPEFYHIANGAVVYTNWQDDSLIERTNRLIADIEEGKKFVSMEAVFTNFDYAVTTPDNYHIVARNQDTAFLTKHLRCYGGTGEFEGCKVGRLLKDITFSGKGYVDRPANPHSIIFQGGNVFNYTTASTENPFSKESGVSFSCSSVSSKKHTENPSMSDTQTADLLKSQNDELKNTVASLNIKVEELTKASSEAGIKKLESEVGELSSKLEAAERARDEAVANIDALTSEKTELSDQLKAATEAKETLEKEVTEAKEAKAKTDRISHLVDAGVDKTIAEAKVELYAGLDDDQFKNIAEDIVSANKMKDEDKDKDKDKKGNPFAKSDDSSSDDDVTEDDAEASADEKVLEDAEATEEPNLTADASDDSDDKMANVRSELQQVFASRLGIDLGDDEAEDSSE